MTTIHNMINDLYTIDQLPEAVFQQNRAEEKLLAARAQCKRAKAKTYLNFCEQGETHFKASAKTTLNRMVAKRQAELDQAQLEYSKASRAVALLRDMLFSKKQS